MRPRSRRAKRRRGPGARSAAATDQPPAAAPARRRSRPPPLPPAPLSARRSRPPRGRAKEQYHGTDPDSRIMTHRTTAGFEQHDNAQVAVEQTSLLIVAPTLSNHPTDQGQALPPVAAISPALGPPAGTGPP